MGGLLADPFEGLPRGQRETRPSGIEQIRKFSDSRFADAATRAFECHEEVFREGLRFDDGATDAVRNQEVAFGSVGPQLGILSRLGCTNPVIHVLVKVGDGYQPVLVAVGVAGAKAADNSMRENRWHAIAERLATFEGVLGAA